MERPAKRTKLISDDESDADADVNIKSVGEEPRVNSFKVNEEYARRFEHNKKREEKDRLEEKYGQSSSKHEAGEEEGSEDSEEDESEDDEAELATKDVDEEIFATLNAIRNKDARVYDENARFYKDFESDAKEDEGAKEKPMYLQDYHRQNLLAGYAGEDDDAKVPITYQQEQDKMRRQLVGSMHATTAQNGDADDSDDGDFLVTKSKPKHDEPSNAPKGRQITEADVTAAEANPETYLSNFMAARAWLPTDTSRWQAFDSDDSEDEKRAENFEDAYNMRFENPATANEKLQSFSRDVGKYSVRREETKSSRQRARDREREKQEATKLERHEEKARLRKLKIEEAEEKVKRIKHAAGMQQGKEIDVDEWRNVIEGDFDDDRWEEEMRRRFGDEYYAAQKDGGDDESGEEGGRRQKKLKKPKWDEEVDIKDLVPDFEDEDDTKPTFTLSSDEEHSEDNGGVPITPPASSEPHKKNKTKKDRVKEKAEAKRSHRRERLAIETLVDNSLPLHQAPTSAGFRYRETSPTSFGLSARDILFADDAQLNQYAGLKKLSGWRDVEKKRKDRKKFSKKARLREWRKEIFGSGEEPKGGFEKRAEDGEMEDGGAVRKGKKRKRSKKGGGGEVEL